MTIYVGVAFLVVLSFFVGAYFASRGALEEREGPESPESKAYRRAFEKQNKSIGKSRLPRYWVGETPGAPEKRNGRRAKGVRVKGPKVVEIAAYRQRKK